MNIALIGYGYWGKNLLRNIIESSLFEKVYVIDKEQEKIQKAKKLFNQVIIGNSVIDILEDDTIEAVIIATPPKTHFEICKNALNHNKNVLVEKPFCLNTKEGFELIDLAKVKNKLFMVDHTFLYTGAVQKIKSLIDKNEIGDIKYIDSVRINLGLFQNDVNGIWDGHGVVTEARPEFITLLGNKIYETGPVVVGSNPPVSYAGIGLFVVY